ncbi:DUF302 domain-containing protein [Halorussus salinisoli]|uniref:DUF302 domain-containing protein n=1 Tax=Halorussus salinisoli TaxID=2558242 RepID=UPI0010C1FE94|nr:DUF302 domain-containing protein [Halorussus salinisoli]
MRDTDRRTFLRATGLAGGLAFTGVAAGQETTTAEGDEEDGLVTVQSDDDFGATVERIRTSIEESENMTLVTTVDHASNAESVGMDLRPTTLFVFGNPQIGTRLMRRSQTAGIDLPQKMLVWEAEDGSVNVTYNDPAWVAERHDVDAPEMLLRQVSDALDSLATGG